MADRLAVTTGGQRTAAVIGLGLVGGSLARDLAGLGWRVIAADRDPATVEAAMASGIVERAFEAGGTAEAVPAGAELVVIATPVRSVPELLRWVARAAPPGATITDVASTKRSVMAAASEAGIARRFVGGHPMAGDHRSGWPAARAGLFTGATVWVCPAGADRSAAERIMRVWTEVGADPILTDADTHDRRVAWSSHLLQVTSSALGAALSGVGIARAELGGGGHDTTRLAASDPDVWLDILMDNADAIAPALDALVTEIARVRRLLRNRDDEGLRRTLEVAREWAAGAGRRPAS